MQRTLLTMTLAGLLGTVVLVGDASACGKRQPVCHTPCAPTPVVMVVQQPCPPPPICKPTPPPRKVKAKHGCGHVRLFARNRPCKKCHPPVHTVMVAHHQPVFHGHPAAIHAAPQTPYAAPQTPAMPSKQYPTPPSK